MLPIIAAGVLAGESASAQPVTTCGSATDCDQDGASNFDDQCPAVNGNTAPTAASGFVSIDCYRPMVPVLKNCIPVAVRPFDEQVPDDAFDPNGPSTHRKGFTYVGVFDKASGGPAAQSPYLDQADPALVAGTAEQFPTNALFACFGSVEIAADGHELTPSPTIYGFRVSSFYAHSMNTAAIEAKRFLGLGSTFNDALGLIEAIRSPHEEIQDYPVPNDQGVRYGIIGTAGTWDDDSGWSRIPETLTIPFPEDLPQVVNDYTVPSCVDAALPASTKGPFGYDAMVPNSLPQTVPQYFSNYFPDDFLGRGLVVTWGGAPCMQQLATPAYVYISHLAIPIPSLPPVFVLGLEVFPGAPATTINLWWVDEPQVWTHAVEQYAHGYPLRRTESPASVELRRARPRWGPWLGVAALSRSLATIYAGSSEIAEVDAPVWATVHGAAFAALKATNVDARPLIQFSQVDGANIGRDISATLFATQVTKQVYDYAKDTWTITGTYTDGDAHQVNSSVLQPGGPSPDDPFFSFATPSSYVQMSVNFWKDEFNPAGDYWEANADASCRTLANRFPNDIAANTTIRVPEEWCPKPFPARAAKYMENPSERVNLCGGYNANIPDQHWPLLAPRIPFASLFGHVQGDPGVQPTGTFAGGDLVRSGLAGALSDKIVLHEGSDINLKQTKQFVEPGSHALYATFDKFVCYGKSVFGAGDTIVSCDDPMVKLCGEEARDGCNPTELAAKVLAKSVSNACACHDVDCSIFSFLCTPLVCAAKSLTVCPVAIEIAAAKFVLSEVKNYGPQAISCLAVIPPGNIDCGGFSLHKDKTTELNLEHEMEYNIAYGAKDIGLGVQHDCDDSLVDIAAECQFEKKVINFSCGALGACPVDLYQKNNFVYGDAFRQVVSVGINKDGIGFSDAPAICGPADEIYPTVVGPGLFQSPSGVWGQMATRAGLNLTCDNATPLRVVPSDVKKPINFDPDHPFRRDMLGDLIIDCGHAPFRPEIHPPVSMYLHLGGKAGRYSLFGWQRKKQGPNEDQSAPITIDLWPATPKPHAGATLGINVLYGDIGGVSGPGWRCGTYPSEGVPDRYRCVLYADGRFANGGGGDDSAQCDKHPRFLPSCQDGVAGGLVEVSWQ